MQVQLESLANAYQDLYKVPTEARTSELEFKVLDLPWEGEFLAAPAQVEASFSGIPVLVLTRRSSLRDWEVDERKNNFVVFTDLLRGETGVIPIYKPPVKRMKPQVEDKGRRPGPEEAYSAGAIRRVIGESWSEQVEGDYAVAFIAYDFLSNQRLIRKQGTTKPVDPAVAADSWPWDRWVNTNAFKSTPALPAVVGVVQHTFPLRTERHGAYALHGSGWHSDGARPGFRDQALTGAFRAH